MDSFFDFDTLHHHLNDNPNPVTNKTARGADARYFYYYFCSLNFLVCATKKKPRRNHSHYL